MSATLATLGELPIPAELHLHRYFQAQREYLELFKKIHHRNQDTDSSQKSSKASSSKHQTVLCTSTKKPVPFSQPDDVSGYNDGWISDDIITEVYLHFNDVTRQDESGRYLRTRSGQSCP